MQTNDEANRLMEEQHYPPEYEDTGYVHSNDCSECGCSLNTRFEFSTGICDECRDIMLTEDLHL